jgi:hypothetical protein
MSISLTRCLIPYPTPRTEDSYCLSATEIVNTYKSLSAEFKAQYGDIFNTELSKLPTIEKLVTWYEQDPLARKTGRETTAPFNVRLDIDEKSQPMSTIKLAKIISGNKHIQSFFTAHVRQQPVKELEMITCKRTPELSEKSGYWINEILNPQVVEGKLMVNFFVRNGSYVINGVNENNVFKIGRKKEKGKNNNNAKSEKSSKKESVITIKESKTTKLALLETKTYLVKVISDKIKEPYIFGESTILKILDVYSVKLDTTKYKIKMNATVHGRTQLETKIKEIGLEKVIDNGFLKRILNHNRHENIQIIELEKMEKESETSEKDDIYYVPKGFTLYHPILFEALKTAIEKQFLDDRVIFGIKKDDIFGEMMPKLLPDPFNEHLKLKPFDDVMLENIATVPCKEPDQDFYIGNKLIKSGSFKRVDLTSDASEIIAYVKINYPVRYKIFLRAKTGPVNDDTLALVSSAYKVYSPYMPGLPEEFQAQVMKRPKHEISLCKIANSISDDLCDDPTCIYSDLKKLGLEVGEAIINKFPTNYTRRMVCNDILGSATSKSSGVHVNFNKIYLKGQEPKVERSSTNHKDVLILLKGLNLYLKALDSLPACSVGFRQDRGRKLRAIVVVLIQIIILQMAYTRYIKLGIEKCIPEAALGEDVQQIFSDEISKADEYSQIDSLDIEQADSSNTLEFQYSFFCGFLFKMSKVCQTAYGLNSSIHVPIFPGSMSTIELKGLAQITYYTINYLKTMAAEVKTWDVLSPMLSLFIRGIASGRRDTSVMTLLITVAMIRHVAKVRGRTPLTFKALGDDTISVFRSQEKGSIDQINKILQIHGYKVKGISHVAVSIFLGITLAFRKYLITQRTTLLEEKPRPIDKTPVIDILAKMVSGVETYARLGYNPKRCTELLLRRFGSVYIGFGKEKLKLHPFVPFIIARSLPYATQYICGPVLFEWFMNQSWEMQTLWKIWKDVKQSDFSIIANFEVSADSYDGIELLQEFFNNDRVAEAKKSREALEKYNFRWETLDVKEIFRSRLNEIVARSQFNIDDEEYMTKRTVQIMNKIRETDRALEKIKDKTGLPTQPQNTIWDKIELRILNEVHKNWLLIEAPVSSTIFHNCECPSTPGFYRPICNACLHKRFPYATRTKHSNFDHNRLSTRTPQIVIEIMGGTDSILRKVMKINSISENEEENKTLLTHLFKALMINDDDIPYLVGKLGAGRINVDVSGLPTLQGGATGIVGISKTDISEEVKFKLNGTHANHRHAEDAIKSLILNWKLIIGVQSVVEVILKTSEGELISFLSKGA